MVQYPVVNWPQFQKRLTWRQGEHAVAIAPTGGGKTTLFARLLERRKYVVVFVTKIRDETVSREFSDYRIIREWGDVRHVHVGRPNRYLLWPKPGNTTRETINRQRAVFGHAFDRIYREGGWTIGVDEEHYISEMLRLDEALKLYLHQARSSDLSLLNGTQRPAYIPVVTYPSSTHAFLWKTTERKDLDRIGELGGIDRRTLAVNLAGLGEHQFVYVNTRDPNQGPVITQVDIGR